MNGYLINNLERTKLPSPLDARRTLDETRDAVPADAIKRANAVA